MRSRSFDFDLETGEISMEYYTSNDNFEIKGHFSIPEGTNIKEKLDELLQTGKCTFSFPKKEEQGEEWSFVMEYLPKYDNFFSETDDESFDQEATVSLQIQIKGRHFETIFDCESWGDNKKINESLRYYIVWRYLAERATTNLQKEKKNAFDLSLPYPEWKSEKLAFFSEQ